MDSLYVGGLKPYAGKNEVWCQRKSYVLQALHLIHSRSALAIVLVLGVANCHCCDYHPHPRHQASILIITAPVQDQFLPQDPVDVPLNASALSNRLQDERKGRS